MMLRRRGRNTSAGPTPPKQPRVLRGNQKINKEASAEAVKNAEGEGSSASPNSTEQAILVKAKPKIINCENPPRASHSNGTFRKRLSEEVAEFKAAGRAAADEYDGAKENEPGQIGVPVSIVFNNEQQLSTAIESLEEIMAIEDIEREKIEEENQKEETSNAFYQNMGLPFGDELDEDEDYLYLENRVIWDPELYEEDLRTIETDISNNQKAEVLVPTQKQIVKLPSPTDQNFYNISNDQYYEQKTPARSSFENSTVIHAKPVREFKPPFIKVPWTEQDLRVFHRPSLATKKQFPVPTLRGKRHRFFSLTKRIQQKAKQREELQKKHGWIGIDSAIDTSGRDGEVVLIEYSEEYPPLLSQIGMASRITNYVINKDPFRKPQLTADFEIGECKRIKELPLHYLAKLEEGESLSSLENNMSITPVYRNSFPETDFLVVINAKCLMIRGDVKHLFTAGQQFPLVKVPKPGSKFARQALQDLIKAWAICELSKEGSRLSKSRKNLESMVPVYKLLKSFPELTERYLKEILLAVVEFGRSQKTNEDMMQIRRGFSLPDEQNLDKVFSPEQYCAFISMLACEQRLKDTFDIEGVATLTKEQMENERLRNELLAAPWNTTSAFLDAIDGKCLLEVNGMADPTGCGEGFSFVHVPMPSQKSEGILGVQREKERFHVKKKISHVLHGTDLELSTLKTQKGQSLLTKMGLPTKELKRLGTEQVRDLLETLSLLKIQIGVKCSAVSEIYRKWKKKRASVFNEEKFKKEFQRTFELQNKVLGSCKPPDSTDGDSEESDYEENPNDLQSMGKQLELMIGYETEVPVLGEKATTKQKSGQEIEFDQEEKERLELIDMLNPKTKTVVPTPPPLPPIKKKHEAKVRQSEMDKRATEDKKAAEEALTKFLNTSSRKKFLKLTRTVGLSDGQEVKREQIVRDPAVIQMYLKLRAEKDQKFIKNFSQVGRQSEKLDRQIRLQKALRQVEELKKQQKKEEEEEEMKYRIEKLRLKFKLQKEYFPNEAERKKAMGKFRNSMKKEKKIKCKKCGLFGHDASSKDCLLFEDEDEIQVLIKMKKAMKQKGKKKRLETGCESGVKLSSDDSSSSDSSDSESGSDSSSADDNHKQSNKQVAIP